MLFLNLGCGYPRIEGEEWINLDNLRSQLAEGTPERDGLDSEPNYIDHDLLGGPLPFERDSFDGVLASHVFEHVDAQSGLRIMEDCRRILKPGGVLLVSVPNASYFRRVYPQDRNNNWMNLFDVSDPNNPIPTFFQAALWFEQHLAILTEDALWCYLTRAGFKPALLAESQAPQQMTSKLNRRKFSLEMTGTK